MFVIESNNCSRYYLGGFNIVPQFSGGGGILGGEGGGLNVPVEFSVLGALATATEYVLTWQLPHLPFP